VRHVPDPADGSVNVTIVTRDGKRIANNIKHAPGDPSFGLQEERTRTKFRACAAYRLAPESVMRVENDLLDLENRGSIAGLMDNLVNIASSRATIPA
jgi:hypothetical protein